MSAHRVTVLLATSDEVQRAALGTGLGRSGYGVRPVGSVAEARRLIDRAAADFVVADLGLSGGGAVTLAHALREDGRTIPFIGLADGPISEEVRRLADGVGIEIILGPPVLAERLTAAIGRVASESATRPRSPGRQPTGPIEERLFGPPDMTPPTSTGPQAPTIDSQVGVMSDGRTFRRKLTLQPIDEDAPAPPPTAVEELEMRRHRSKIRLGALTAATLVLAAVLLWWAIRSPERDIQVRVLEDVQEPARP